MKKPVKLLSATLLGTCLSLGVLPAASAGSLPVAVDGQELPSLAPMLERVTPAVVNIATKGTQTTTRQMVDPFEFFFGNRDPRDRTIERPFRALGSGVIIDAEKGFLLTNHHVVEEADEITVTLRDGRQFEAKRIGSDKASDIAVLQIEPDELTALQKADSDNLKVGDFAVAIGNPFGLGQTVTSGIVSALGRSGLNIGNLENFIQTDASINQGNSGGALVNLRGELIGINTAIIGPSGGNVGIGFAIPANMAFNLADQIIKFGEVRRGLLGIAGGELTSELSEALGYDTQRGAFVNQVFPDSAAEKAGLKPGDIIVSVNTKPINSFGELRARIGSLGAGSQVELGLVREGKSLTVPVTLQRAEAEQLQARVLHPMLEGATLTNTTRDSEVEGIEVSELDARSPAAAAGFEKGDIIVALNREPINSLSQLREELDKEPNVMAFKVVRGTSSLYLVLR